MRLVEPEGGAARIRRRDPARARRSEVEIILGRRSVGEHETRARRASGRDRQKPAPELKSPWPLAHARQQRTGPARLAAPGDRRFASDPTSISTSTGSTTCRCCRRPSPLEMRGRGGRDRLARLAGRGSLRTCALLQRLQARGRRPRGLEMQVLGGEHGDASRLQRVGGAAIVGRGRPAALSRLASSSATRCPGAGGGLGACSSPAAAPLSAREAYRDRLFHGPCFQAVTRLVGLDETGAVAEVRAERAVALQRERRRGSNWLFDPALSSGARRSPGCGRAGSADRPRCRTASAASGASPSAGEARRMQFAVEPRQPEHEVRADVARRWTRRTAGLR